MPSIRTWAALAAIALAASLAGCATAPPGSVEEQLWFDKPIGGDIYDVPPDARMRGLVGYPRTGCCQRVVPPPVEEP